VDDVVIIDDMGVLTGGGAAPCQGHQQRAADEQIQAVIVQSDPQAMADEPGRHRVEHLPERETARRGDGDDRLLVIAGPLPGQPPERGPFGRDALGMVGVLAAYDLVDEATIAGEIFEVGDPAHQQRVAGGLPEMAVRTFDPAILMGHPAVVAGRLHPVMGAQCVIAPSQIFTRIVVQVAERGREAVAAMLERRATQRPQRILQSFGQRDIAFAAEDHVGMLEARVGKPEVIEPVIEPNPGDRDAQVGHVGEV
jgi:hypothetical protein